MANPIVVAGVKQALILSIPKFIKALPKLISQITPEELKEWSKQDKELLGSLYEKANILVNGVNKSFDDSSEKFQEMSHTRIVELFNSLDLTSLKSKHKAKIATTKIESETKMHKSNILGKTASTIVTVLALSVVTIVKLTLDYDLRRPRSVFEKFLGRK